MNLPLVILGEPKLDSIRTLRPLGPSVVETALARVSTPARRAARPSTPNLSSCYTSVDPLHVQFSLRRASYLVRKPQLLTKTGTGAVPASRRGQSRSPYPRAHGALHDCDVMRVEGGGELKGGYTVIQEIKTQEDDAMPKLGDARLQRIETEDEDGLGREIMTERTGGRGGGGS